MTSTSTEEQKYSAREKPEVQKVKEKNLDFIKNTGKEGIEVKHRRNMSTDFQLSSIAN